MGMVYLVGDPFGGSGVVGGRGQDELLLVCCGGGGVMVGVNYAGGSGVSN